jgi:hypothetical protein
MKFTIQFEEVKSDQFNVMKGLYAKITRHF